MRYCIQLAIITFILVLSLVITAAIFLFGATITPTRAVYLEELK